MNEPCEKICTFPKKLRLRLCVEKKEETDKIKI